MATATLPPDSSMSAFLSGSVAFTDAPKTPARRNGVPTLPPAKPPLPVAYGATPAPDNAEPMRRAALWLCLVVVATAAYTLLSGSPV